MRRWWGSRASSRVPRACPLAPSSGAPPPPPPPDAVMHYPMPAAAAAAAARCGYALRHARRRRRRCYYALPHARRRRRCGNAIPRARRPLPRIVPWHALLLSRGARARRCVHPSFGPPLRFRCCRPHAPHARSRRHVLPVAVAAAGRVAGEEALARVGAALAAAAAAVPRDAFLATLLPLAGSAVRAPARGGGGGGACCVARPSAPPPPPPPPPPPRPLPRACSALAVARARNLVAERPRAQGDVAHPRERRALAGRIIGAGLASGALRGGDIPPALWGALLDLCQVCALACSCVSVSVSVFVAVCVCGGGGGGGGGEGGVVGRVLLSPPSIFAFAPLDPRPRRTRRRSCGAPSWSSSRCCESAYWRMRFVYSAPLG